MTDIPTSTDTPTEAPAAKAKGAGPKKLTGEAQVIARTLGFAAWRREFVATQPEATEESRKEAWQAAREQYLEMGRALHQALKRAGYTVAKPQQDEAEPGEAAPKKAAGKKGGRPAKAAAKSEAA